MNRFDKVNDILNGFSVRLRGSYFQNNYPDIYDEIVEYSNSILNISFKERVWYWVNFKEDEFLCKCGKRTTFNKNWIEGYRKYCSPKCSQSEESTKEKRRKTTLEKWGVDNVAKLDEIKNRQEITNLNKWGTKSTFQNKEVREKWRANVHRKYGVEHVFQLKKVKDKSKITTFEKWGTEHFVQSDFYKKVLEDIGFSNILREHHIMRHFQKYSQIGLKFIGISDRVLKLEGECGHVFEIHYDSLKRRIENNYQFCTVCNPLNSGQSQEEKIITQWLNEIGIETVEKDRSFGIELDILISSHNIAIEYNGLYWHSELFKNSQYHLNKTKICNDNGIRLIHIWEDDWLFRRDIVKSIILNSLGYSKNKIYARKCNIRTITSKEKDDFLDQNHIQGKSVSGVNLGLEYQGELVSVMTFGKRNINSKQEYELVRFCNKKYTVVVGSASKIFKRFIKNWGCNYIISYADVSHFTGDLYLKLGFQLSHRSKPNYWWVVGGIRYHRFTYNKKRLVKEGADPSKTEVSIMYDKGNFRIFGCGQDKYIFKI